MSDNNSEQSRRTYQKQKRRPWRVSAHGVFCPYCDRAAVLMSEPYYYQTEHLTETGTPMQSVEMQYACICEDWQRLHNPDDNPNLIPGRKDEDISQ